MQKIVAWVPPKLLGLTLWQLQGRLRLNNVAQLPFGRGKAIGALTSDWRLGGADSLQHGRPAGRQPAACRKAGAAWVRDSDCVNVSKVRIIS